VIFQGRIRILWWRVSIREMLWWRKVRKVYVGDDGEVSRLCDINIMKCLLAEEWINGFFSVSA